ncbi:MAG: hypothetical protein IPM47_04235 [Sphingobacteriales bacterium]|nr:MAG: hypothetical protein IPM47_04235 [Sphingobacteriales bacterium]
MFIKLRRGDIFVRKMSQETTGIFHGIKVIACPNPNKKTLLIITPLPDIKQMRLPLGVKPLFAKRIILLMSHLIRQKILGLLFWGVLSVMACKQNDSPVSVSEFKVRTPTGLPVTERISAMSEQEAIALAEAFVAAQGYTGKQPDLSKVALQFEKNEYASDSAGVLKGRFNMLKPKATGARQYDQKKWLVGFEYTGNEENIARAVTMDSIGSKIFMQSQDVRIDWILGESD